MALGAVDERGKIGERMISMGWGGGRGEGGGEGKGIKGPG